MNKLFTITSEHTTRCNDRSFRHSSLESAIESATKRLENNPQTVKAVVILESIRVVRPKPVSRPVEVLDMCEYDNTHE